MEVWRGFGGGGGLDERRFLGFAEARGRVRARRTKCAMIFEPECASECKPRAWGVAGGGVEGGRTLHQSTHQHQQLTRSIILRTDPHKARAPPLCPARPCWKQYSTSDFPQITYIYTNSIVPAPPAHHQNRVISSHPALVTHHNNPPSVLRLCPSTTMPFALVPLMWAMHPAWTYPS